MVAFAFSGSGRGTSKLFMITFLNSSGSLILVRYWQTHRVRRVYAWATQWPKVLFQVATDFQIVC